MPPYESSEIPILSQDLYFDDEVPKHVNNDMLLAYFRARFEDRIHLLEQFDPSDRERVLRELRRVAVLREAYSSRVENKDAESRLEHLRREWRAEAVDLCQTRQESVAKRTALMKKLLERERARRKQWEYAILQKVKIWDKRPPKSLPEEAVLEPSNVESEETNIKSERPVPRGTKLLSYYNI
jgi:hypothetical protein